MRNEVKEFKRQRLFDLYDVRSNPFLFVTTKIDITNIVNYCKIHKNYYATIAYFINLAASEMDCFKYRKEENKIYKYDDLRIQFVQMFNEDDIGFFDCNPNTDYKTYIENFKKSQDNFKKTGVSSKSEDLGEFWVSCAPWFEFTSLIPPFDNSMSVPQFIWGKFVEENDKTYTNLMIMIHHGFADGNHIGIFINKLNEKISNFDKYIERMV